MDRYSSATGHAMRASSTPRDSSRAMAFCTTPLGSPAIQAAGNPTLSMDSEYFTIKILQQIAKERLRTGTLTGRQRGGPTTRESSEWIGRRASGPYT